MTFIDPIGHPIKIGSLILTKNYGKTHFTLLTRVKGFYSCGAVLEYTDSYGETGEIHRNFKELVVIDAQLKHNKINYPEYQL